MKRTLLAAALTLALSANAATAKTYLVIVGIGGRAVAPMTEIVQGLQKKGHKVIYADWFAVPDVKVDVAIGHSAGADAALKTGAKKILTLDPTFVNTGCPARTKCINWHNPFDAFPFVVCCGGYPVRGATNIIAPAGHTQMPARMARAVVKEAVN